MLPYAPVVELLTELVRREGADGGPSGRRSRGSRARPARAGPRGPARCRRSTATGSTRLFQAVSTLLQNLSFRRPLLIVIEDLHWADTSTRELLALLARQQPGDVVLLLTLRTDESPAPAGLARYLAELVRRSDHRVIAPAAQPRAAGPPDQRHPRRPAAPAAARRRLRPRRGQPVLRRGAAGAVPARRRRPAGHRAGPAGGPARDPHPGDPAGPAHRERDRAHPAAPAARGGRGRVRGASRGRAAVGGQGPRAARRRRRAVVPPRAPPGGGRSPACSPARQPGRTAGSPRRSPGTRSWPAPARGVAGRLARHWAEAGDPAQALVASVAAAREASDALAFAESLSHYERALELIDAVPDAEALLDLPRARLLHWAAEVAHLAAHPDRATELVREAIARVDPDDLHLHGWLHERLGRYLWMSADTRNALAAYERAVELVPAEPATRGRAAVLSGLSQMLMLADRFEESEALAREAIAVAQRVPDGRSVEGHARCNLGVDLAYTGRLEEAIAELRDGPSDRRGAVRRRRRHRPSHGQPALDPVRPRTPRRVRRGGAGERAGGRDSGTAASQGCLEPHRRGRGADHARPAGRGWPGSSTRPGAWGPRASTRSGPT